MPNIETNASYNENEDLFQRVNSKLLRILEGGELTNPARSDFGKAAKVLRKVGMKSRVDGEITEGLYGLFLDAMKPGMGQEEAIEKILSCAFYLESLESRGDIPSGEEEHYREMERLFEGLYEKTGSGTQNLVPVYVFRPSERLGSITNPNHRTQLEGVAEVPAFRDLKNLARNLQHYFAFIIKVNTDSPTDSTSIWPVRYGSRKDGPEIGHVKVVYSDMMPVSS